MHETWALNAKVEWWMFTVIRSCNGNAFIKDFYILYYSSSAGTDTLGYVHVDIWDSDCEWFGSSAVTDQHILHVLCAKQ